MVSSKFIEILDDNSADTTAQQHQMSDSDVKLEDVLADQEQQHSRSRSSTQSFSSRKSHEECDPRTSTSCDGVDSSSSSPSSPSTSSSTTPSPKIKRLRKFTLTGGFSR
ncbi:hypothetical protein UA08_07147 [Talaromyces atroroseus]|uniref:Uncharacterized protein n=1 Tax=Talaromyces atroroseus TaxID=1441469 RepID=A0A225AWA4_TALAT|nr:hypothetical protein UA08_07147 [Talaromyces atroroseus]OKL57777.1 hypothetical protein UA08_07147 [Talaromyces atroroseus]